MANARHKAKPEAILEAAQALAAAAKSLASAAEALALLCDNEDTNHNTGLATAGHKLNAEPPSGSVVDYEDSDDEYMIKAREQVRVEVASWERRHDPATLDPISDDTHDAPGHQGSLVTLGTVQSQFAEKLADKQANANMPLNMTRTNGVRSFPEDSRSSHPEDPSSHRAVTPEPVAIGIAASVFSPPSRTWANIANGNSGTWGAAPPSGHSVTSVPLDWDATSTGAEMPRTPFQNLVKRWPRPTKLQQEILESIRAGLDMLVCYGHMKSFAQAILVHCMETLGALPQVFPPEGAISALIIVPQQTAGRLWLNFANELLHDFGLPHKALLLPGGGSDIITEAERMASERIDILISSPRVFINHVNNNLALRLHLTNLRFMIYPEARELTNKDEFLNFQLNMIKKRLPTRAKSPRQIIITSSTWNDQIEKFAARAFAPNSATVNSTNSGDDPLDIEWQELLRD